MCPACHTTFTVMYWDSVNVTVDPHMRDEVLDGTLQRRSCPKCGQNIVTDADLLYHDMKRQFMIYYQLCEKIRIFEAGLNDSHIEFIKMFVADRVYGHIDFEHDCIYFAGSRDSGDLGFEVYQNGRLWRTCSWPISEYERVAAEVQQQVGDNFGAGQWKIVSQETIRGT